MGVIRIAYGNKPSANDLPHDTQPNSFGFPLQKLLSCFEMGLGCCLLTRGGAGMRIRKGGGRRNSRASTPTPLRGRSVLAQAVRGGGDRPKKKKEEKEEKNFPRLPCLRRETSPRAGQAKP